MMLKMSKLDQIEYCEDAYKLLKKKVLCGQGCPLLDNCPRLILEDAADETADRVMDAIIKLRKGEGGKWKVI